MAVDYFGTHSRVKRKMLDELQFFNKQNIIKKDILIQNKKLYDEIDKKFTRLLNEQKKNIQKNEKNIQSVHSENIIELEEKINSITEQIKNINIKLNIWIEVDIPEFEKKINEFFDRVKVVESKQENLSASYHSFVEKNGK